MTSFASPLLPILGRIMILVKWAFVYHNARSSKFERLDNQMQEGNSRGHLLLSAKSD